MLGADERRVCAVKTPGALSAERQAPVGSLGEGLLPVPPALRLAFFVAHSALKHGRPLRCR